MARRTLTHKEETRIRRAIDDRIAFFAPTISPAPKNLERNEIESLESAIRFYYESGAAGVIIQPKYMGSYCDIYLHRDIEKTRFFSRRGYPVRLPHDEMIEAVRPLHENIFGRLSSSVEIVLVQSELMPWSALGKGLIERDFGGYEIAHQTHHDYIRSTDLFSDIAELRSDSGYRQFLIDQSTLSRKELKKKYPSHVVAQYEALIALEIPKPDEYIEDIELYSEQLERFGSDSPIQFKPFNILKLVYSSGSEEIVRAHDSAFSLVSEDNYVSFRFDGPGLANDEYINGQIERAYGFYRELTEDQKMEGVIVKPIGDHDPDLVPMFKVRSNNYLQLIYGVNFSRNFDYYISRRSVGKKMRASRNQWNIGQALLAIPMNEINPDNAEYVRLVRGRIYEEDFEKILDSRL